jgi:sigma-B regulation protein RsbU (phosphoserine phosphatase)
MTLRLRLMLLVTALSIAATTAFTVYAYRHQREHSLALIQDQLEGAAATALHDLPKGYHERIAAGQPVAPEEYRRLAVELMAVAKPLRVSKLYTLVQKDGRILFATHSGTSKTFATQDFPPYGSEYRMAPDILRKAFRTGRTTHGIYTDEWGDFMSVFVPVAVGERGMFVIGADQTLRRVNVTLRRTMLGAIGTGAVMLAIVLVALNLAVTRLMRPLTALAESTDVLVRRDFALDEYDRGPIAAIAAGRADEVGRLATSLANMQTRLQTYLANLQAETAARERIEQELSIAREIQRRMLPATFPPYPDRVEIDLYAIMEPAEAVGGDLYDFFLVDDDRLLFLVGDVSDKGVPAALHMTIVRALFKNAMATTGMTLVAAMGAVNRFLTDNNPSQMFATVLAGILDLKTGYIEFVDAGHEPPFARRAGEVTLIKKRRGGMALGILADSEYNADSLQLAPGDTFFLYSDGVNEAMNEHRAQFRVGRIDTTLSALDPASPAKATVEAVLTAVREFAGAAPQSDDITILAVRYLGPAAPRSA